MRLIPLTAACVLAVIPATHAQNTRANQPATGPGTGTMAPSATPSAPVNTAPNAVPSGASSGTVPVDGARNNTQLNPDNCGTPDEPKACPPMRRR
jgi:hypothetical protein